MKEYNDLLNHYIENCDEDTQISVVVVFGYDENKDQFFIYSYS